MMRAAFITKVALVSVSLAAQRMVRHSDFKTMQACIKVADLFYAPGRKARCAAPCAHCREWRKVMMGNPNQAPWRKTIRD